jgi:hypothetical protein
MQKLLTSGLKARFTGGLLMPFVFPFPYIPVPAVEAVLGLNCTFLGKDQTKIANGYLPLIGRHE